MMMGKATEMKGEAIRVLTLEETDLLSNVMIKSKKTVDTFHPRGHQRDSMLNYGGEPKLSTNIEVELLTCISMLEECHELYQRKLQRKHQLYNFFLDDTEGEDDERVERVVEARLKQGRRVKGYSLRDTWTKGGRKGYFCFVKKGQMLHLLAVQGGWAQIQFQEGVGLFRLNDIRIVGQFQ